MTAIAIEKHEAPFKLDMSFGEAIKRLSKVNSKDLFETDAVDNFAENTKTATPFIKWVGGKRSIIEELTSRLPPKLNDYYEPFVGGGALFFELHDRLGNAHLSDTNIDLLITYQAVKLDTAKLIALLEIHAKKHSDAYYYEIRAQQTLKNPIEIAARFIYLNKTCFNGLYRVNSKGEFNVPVGKYTNPGIVTPENLFACSKSLAKTTIRMSDYKQIKPKAGDFVYFDPPYHPTSDTASFTAYSKDGFSEKDQAELRDFYKKLSTAGVNVMLSNSNTPYIQKLYKGFNIDIVDAPRQVNCKPGKRNAVEEVLITNYKYA